MSEIPADIISLADQACNQCYDPKTSTWFNVRDIIALAILAERDRCAKIAESEKSATVCSGYNSGWSKAASCIEAAIRRR